MSSNLYMTSTKAVELAADYQRQVRKILDILPYQRILELAEGLAFYQNSEMKIYLAGNGGSAANASHCAAHLDDVGIVARCLSDNIPLLTARSNDDSYANAFARQIQNASMGDAVLVFSCSGKSPNIISLLREARKKEMKCYGLFGFAGNGAEAPGLCDCAIVLNSSNYGVIEDVHSMIIHILKEILTE